MHANYCRSKNFRPPIAKNNWIIFLHFNKFAYDLPLIFLKWEALNNLEKPKPTLGHGHLQLLE